MATMMTATAPHLLTVWGQELEVVAVGTSATVLGMDHHPLSMVPMLTHQFLWCMALNPLKSTRTRSLTYSVSMAM